MSQIGRLVANYQRFVKLPWSAHLAGSQRVWFAVYPPAEERRLRVRLQEFEAATIEAGHGWRSVDITSAPARWLGAHAEREGCFAEPEALVTLEEELQQQVVCELRQACEADGVEGNTVLAVVGAGSLFGFISVSAVVRKLEDSIRGRLLVFFPGEYERNILRIMDAHDGFNYLGVPITCSERLPV